MAALADHLWTGGPCPPEYLELILCRDVYHCLPQELMAIDPITLLTHMTCLSLEADARTAASNLT